MCFPEGLEDTPLKKTCSNALKKFEKYLLNS